MIKKIVIGACGAALVVAGAASAAQLSTPDETLAAGVVEVSGASLEDVSFDTTWIGLNNGTSPQQTAPAIQTITFDFGADDAGLVVEGGLLKTNGGWAGYFGPDALNDPANFTTDANGVLTIDISSKKFLAKDLGGLNLNVYSG
ncbi:hypothetical protein [Demequina globuliformis]|uniref:hypothetical protein n=1 Tax=Demequina globuliformis TaxID=676202 RepID=UPI00078223DB|nr:hypothetical protein [Demequina globuliformis]